MEYSVFFWLLFVLTGTSACSRVGTDIQSSSDDSDFQSKRGLFLNLGSPSECQSIVTAWHLHYELEECSSQRTQSGQTKSSRGRETERETFNGVFAVYRLISNLTMQYQLVPGSTKSVKITCDGDDIDDDDDTRTRSNTRRTRSNAIDQEEIILLEKQEWFTIQRGDVIAICLPDIKRRYRLQILEDVRSENKGNAAPGVHVYAYNGEKYALENCNFNGLQTIRSGFLKARRRYRLNLYAEITGPELATTTLDTSIEDDSNSPPLNNTQMLSDNQKYLILVTAPSASAGGLLVLIAAVVLVAGIVVCWSRRCKRRRSISLSAREAAANSNKLQDTRTDQQSSFTQSRSAVISNNMMFDIKENVAYQGYNFDEHVYAQPHKHHLKTHRNYERNEYEIASYY